MIRKELFDGTHEFYNFDVTYDFFDPNRFIVKLNKDAVAEIQSEESAVNETDDKGGSYKLHQTLSLFHEYQHYLNLMCTPMGIYDNLLRITSFAQISFHLKAFLRDGTQLKLPFCKHMDDHPIIASTYRHAFSISAYFHCKFNHEKTGSIDDIKGLKLIDIDCSELYEGTSRRILKQFPSVFVTFNSKTGVPPKDMPIGLYSILEGFARLNQDRQLMQQTGAKKFVEQYLKRKENKAFTVYYLLDSYAYNILYGLELNEIFTILYLSFYFSLVCIRPINQWPYDIFGFYGTAKKEVDDKMEQFLSNLSHPGYTFLDVLFTLKDLAAEGEKISRDKKCIMHLMQKVCERIGCRPVNFLYELFGSFLEKTINNQFPIEFHDYPFAKYYLTSSLQLMKAAAKDPYVFMFYPWQILEETGLMPMVFTGKYIINHDTSKYDWFLFSNIMDQFLHKKRIFCHDKIYFGANTDCKNNADCSVDKTDYPYSKCEDDFLKLINWAIGDPNNLVSA